MRRVLAMCCLISRLEVRVMNEEPTLEMIFGVLQQRFPKELEIAVLQARLALALQEPEGVDGSD